MPAVSASAPAKIILFGEHAAVYARPAIAIPLTLLRAKAYFLADPAAPVGSVKLTAPNISLHADLRDLPDTHPLRVLFRAVQNHLQIGHFPAMSVKISSEIPIAAGFGSGTAVSVALIRGLAGFLGVSFTAETISALAFEVEKIYHGSPSGVDNTVVAYEQPVYFVKGSAPEPIAIGGDFTFLIAESGIQSSTAQVVEQVRRARDTDTPFYDTRFDAIAGLVNTAKTALQSGDANTVGALMYQNHKLLRQIGVSCDKLDELVRAAQQAGALGAKLSGAGQGGNVIALVQSAGADRVRAALEAAGAVKVLQTVLTKTRGKAVS
jgi:mevalonate kinase